MKNIKHIFFDLDRTLWDFEKNTTAVLYDLYENTPELKKLGNKFQFVKRYKSNNNLCWSAYYRGKITKEQLRLKRFQLTLESYFINNVKLAIKLNEKYIDQGPKKIGLLDNANEILEYLISKKYKLHIITNGFSESQIVKLETNNISKYFNTITCSDTVNYHKPNKKIFEIALEKANATNVESAYIGDNFHVDVKGALNAKMTPIYYNRKEKKTFSKNKDYYTINNLIELKQIFKS